MHLQCFVVSRAPVLNVVSHTFFPSASAQDGNSLGRRAGMCGVTSHNVTHDVTGSAVAPQS